MATEAAPANSASLHVESDRAQTSISLDDAANLDFDDPVEDNVETDDEAQSDNETVEADDEGQETDETAAEDDDGADEDGESDESDEDDAETGEEGESEEDGTAQPVELKDDQVITLPNGETMPFGEVKSGYMRQADYSRKTQDLSNQRRDLETLATNVNQAVEAVAEHLQKTLPEEPDPNLAVTDPNAYTRKKALYDHAMGQISEVLQAAHAPKEAVNKLTEQQHQEIVRSETAKLAETFPQIQTKDGHKKFFDTAAATAKDLGYSDEEIGQATDHRLFKLAHYARLGMEAEAAKAKAKDKVRDAPPVAPTKRQKGKGSNKGRKNAEGMQKLQKSGSIHDAMSIDFE